MCRHTHAMLERANEAARSWGYKWPRRWRTTHGGITYISHLTSAELRAEYYEHRAAITALVPKIQVENPA